jgi:hypothetical protein
VPLSQRLSAALHEQGSSQQITEDGVGDGGGDGEQVRFYWYRVIEISSLLVVRLLIVVCF